MKEGPLDRQPVVPDRSTRGPHVVPGRRPLGTPTPSAKNKGLRGDSLAARAERPASKAMPVTKPPIAYDFTPNALFRSGPNPHWNACVGDNGGPYDFADYGKGFFDGGRAIIEAAKDTRWPLDLLVYPAAFSFRHGIELYLKHLLRGFISLEGNGARYEKHHGIEEYFSLVAAEMRTVGPPVFDATEVGIAGDIIKDFCQIDPTGQVFRYPEDIKGNKHLTGLRLINVEVLGDGMRVLHELLERWRYQLEYIIDYQREHANG